MFTPPSNKLNMCQNEKPVQGVAHDTRQLHRTIARVNHKHIHLQTTLPDAPKEPEAVG